MKAAMLVGSGQSGATSPGKRKDRRSSPEKSSPTRPRSSPLTSFPSAPAACFEVESRRHSIGASGSSQQGPWVKLIKFREGPHVKQLCEQLDQVAEILPQ